MVVDSSTGSFLSSALGPLLRPSSGGLGSLSGGVHDSSAGLVGLALVTSGFAASAVVSETTQKPVKGALGNRRSKGTDQRLAMIRSVQLELMR